ncbi:MAG TPA: N-acetyl-alpha-D-glucosaminyl L-malate synthase BshA [Flavobacteriales bacterium]|jgi:N-acetyl-alpha-D-glucosaminyl L-malate synthase BshA|nr:N-acetyl-alpha-D-glucosaminyl L-malate synthase BshA [Flavobacteriales bacterium]HIN41358.1 N-acetyl-alpha-D-glucosaminyl L-malate synthase BshA [Flavobacteriales bacterium]HIO15604.1 N-acetyl-alpha-D-glucosaminyl L-malate synthase BshA [Flavobacteriales bacterium]HIO59320.1 N-acetyl-alpha-D-glucosaminyl L-malate synthase BshA [Flavobacteriales bacterium]
MKIGMVCYPTFGGSGVVATELGKALASQGHEVHFITYNTPVRLGSFRPNIFYHEVRISDYPLFDYPPYELVLASKMVEVAKDYALDLIHVHYAIPHASAAVTAQKILAEEGIKLPIITTLHGTDITLLGKDPSFEPVITYAINSSDAVTAVSENLKAETNKLFGVIQEIEVIPNFFCPFHYKLEPNEEFRKKIAPEGQPIITHISNFRPVKRILDVVETFYLISKELDVRLLLVGDGPDRNVAEIRCRELGIDKKVVTLGKVKNPIEPLLVSDLFLLPSKAESFGLAALEAMASGVPVISSNTGGLPELNKEGVSGFMSDVGDVQDMAKNALEILKSPESLAKFKASSLLRAEEFRIDLVLPKYLALYQKVTKK